MKKIKAALLASIAILLISACASFDTGQGSFMVVWDDKGEPMREIDQGGDGACREGVIAFYSESPPAGHTARCVPRSNRKLYSAFFSFYGRLWYTRTLRDCQILSMQASSMPPPVDAHRITLQGNKISTCYEL